MSTSDHSTFRCQCGAKLKIPATAAGKRLKCPKCGFRFEVPAAGVSALQESASGPASRPAPKATARPRPAAPPPPPVPHDDEEDGLLNDLMGMEQAAETTAQSSVLDHQKTCPKCKAAMAKDLMVCLSCGHDLAAPVAQKSKSARSAPGEKERGFFTKLAFMGGRLALGTTLSAVGALIGAVVWAIVAVALHLEIGYVAIGVGLLAGFGMMVGYNNQTTMAGLIAAGMAFMGIMGAKILIFAYVVYSFVGGGLGDFDFEHHAVAGHYADRRADAEGISPWSDRRSEYHDEELAKVQNMSDEEIQSELARIEAWEEEKWEDPAYIRTHLIYHHAGECDAAADEAAERRGEYDPDAPYDPVAMEAQWKGCYEPAVAKVDALTADEQKAAVDQMLADQKKAEEELLAQWEEEFGESGEEGDDEELSGSSILTMFFFAMFGGMDILFVLLAAGAAFQLASGGGDTVS